MASNPASERLHSTLDTHRHQLRRARYCDLPTQADVLQQITAYPPPQPNPHPTTATKHPAAPPQPSVWFWSALAYGASAAVLVLVHVLPLRQTSGLQAPVDWWGLWQWRDEDEFNQIRHSGSISASCTYSPQVWDSRNERYTSQPDLTVPGCGALVLARVTAVLLMFVLLVHCILTLYAIFTERNIKRLNDLYTIDIHSNGNDTTAAIHPTTAITSTPPVPPRAPYPTQQHMTAFHITQQRQLIDRLSALQRYTLYVLLGALLIGVISMIAVGIFTHQSALQYVDMATEGWFWHVTVCVLLLAAVLRWLYAWHVVRGLEADWQKCSGGTQEAEVPQSEPRLASYV